MKREGKEEGGVSALVFWCLVFWLCFVVIYSLTVQYTKLID